MRNDEHNLQAACVTWFDLQNPKYKLCLMAIPNGGHRHKAVAGKLKAEGVRAGAADMFLAVKVGSEPYHGSAEDLYYGAFIELKTPTGRQQPSQKAFQAAVEDQGYLYVIIRTFEQFQEFITQYLG